MENSRTKNDTVFARSASTTAEHVPAGPNRRREGRRRTLFTGMLASCSGAFTIDCTVTNFSMSGARVRVESGSLIFGKILLIHLRERLAFETKVAWRNDRD